MSWLGVLESKGDWFPFIVPETSAVPFLVFVFCLNIQHPHIGPVTSSVMHLTEFINWFKAKELCVLALACLSLASTKKIRWYYWKAVPLLVWLVVCVWVWGSAEERVVLLFCTVVTCRPSRKWEGAHEKYMMMLSPQCTPRLNWEEHSSPISDP